MIFISYAREDRVFAARLSNQLDEEGVPHWIDTRSIAPGQDWKREITLALKTARYVLLLISSNSVSKRGYVQREVKEALENLKEFPAGDVFIIPVRLDDAKPQDLDLQNLNWFDLFPDVNLGMRYLVDHLKSLDLPRTPADDLKLPIGSKGRGTVLAPYKNFGEVVRTFLSTFPRVQAGSSEIAYFVSISTKHEGVVLPPLIVEKFPEATTIVLQNQYENLSAGAEEISIDLWFYGERATVVFPYDAICHIPDGSMAVS